MFWWTALGAVCVYPCILIGPDFWGLVHKQWRMCKSGKMQSPINIDPEGIIFDPGLSQQLSVGRTVVRGDFFNVGQFPTVFVNTTVADTSLSKRRPPPASAASDTADVINISGGFPFYGPAYPYTYRLHQVIVHFGDVRTGHRGSEHTLDRQRYPAEIQLIGYNSDLYENFTEAMAQPRGLLAISIIVDIGEATNTEFRRITLASRNITFKNTSVRLERFQPALLMPKTEHYVTYEGSLTFPGCYETVTWIVMNSPIYTTINNLAIWNQLQQSEENSPAGSQSVPMAPNFRPLRAVNGRMIRSNINIKMRKVTDQGACPSNIYLDAGYKSNQRRKSSHLQRPRHPFHEQHQQMEAKNGSVHFSSTIPNVKIAAGGKSRRHLESYELLGDEVRFGGGNFDGVTPLATGITDEEEQEQFDVFEKPSGRPTRVWYDDYISSSSEATKSAGED